MLKELKYIDAQWEIGYNSGTSKTHEEDATNVNPVLTTITKGTRQMAAIDSTTKTCTKCKQTYPATTEFFPPRKAGRGGLNSQCRICLNAYFVLHRQDTLEHRREYERAYRAANLEKERQKQREWGRAHRAKRRAYATAHPEQSREYSRLYRKRHPHKIQAYNKEYRKNNSDKIRAIHREYGLTHPDKIRAASHRRRALKRESEGYQLPFDEKAQLKRQHGKCYYCQTKLTEYHIEHVIPLSRGGSDHPDNKVLACPSCNLSKHDKLPHEWSKGGRLL